MIKINENSAEFQKEVICYLFQKIFEGFIKEPLRKKNCNSSFINLINEKKINSVESLLSNLDFIIKEYSLPKSPVDDFIRKNYFKAIQIIKKQKEMLNTFLKNEDSLKLLSREIFLKDLSQGKFLWDDQDKYSLKFSDKEIPEIGLEKNPVYTQLPQEEVENKIKEKKNFFQEEISVLKELLTLFPEIETRPKDILKNISKFDYEIIEEKKFDVPEKKEKAVNVSISVETSILQEILDSFGLILKEKERKIEELQNLIKTEKEDNSFIEHYPVNSITNHINNAVQDFEKIPLEIGLYWDLRVKLQNFKVRNQIQEYQEFLNHADNHIKACVGILNIMNKESQYQNFSKDNALQNLANNLDFSYESINELYNRIKKYNTCLGYVRQGGQYLKEKSPKLYPFFLKIQTSILELLDGLEEYSHLNNDDFKKELEKKIKILLLFVQEEEIRTNLMNFLISFFVKARNTIIKS